MTLASLEGKVIGRVQGVGFRYFVLRKAQEFNLCGWVRNNADGSVSFEVEGEKKDILEFLFALDEGPELSRVDEIKKAWYDYRGRWDRFSITC